MIKENAEYPMNVFQKKYGSDITWVVEYPDLPGCVGNGDTSEDAIKEATENARIYLEELKEMGKPIPAPTVRTVE